MRITRRSFVGQTGLTTRQEFMVSLSRSEERLRRLNDYLAANFSFNTLCPTGGDQATWLESILDIRNSLQALRQKPSEGV